MSTRTLACLTITVALLLPAYGSRAQQPQLAVQQGHAQQIFAVAFSPDGRLVASASEDHSLKLWDSDTGFELRTLEGHNHWVTCLAFSRDGKLLASGSADRSIRLWDVASGRVLRTLQGHTGSVQGLAFLPDGKTVVSGANDRSINFWDVATGNRLRTFAGHTREIRSLSLSADGRTLATASYDRTIRVWDVASGQVRRAINQRVAAMAMSPDGTTIATGGYAVQLWDAASGSQRRRLEEIQAETPDSRGAPSAALAFSGDGRLLASVSGRDSSLKVWEVASGKLRWKCCNRFNSGLAFSPDGRTLAGGGIERRITIRDAGLGGELRSLGGHVDSMHSVAFSPDGRALLTGRYSLFDKKHEAIKSWDLVSGAPPRALPGDESSAYDAVFSADGRQLASGGLDNNIFIRDFAGGRLLRVIGSGGPVDHLVATSNGKLLASASRDAFVSLWDADAGRLRRKIEAHAKVINAIALSPGGEMLASAGNDRLIKVWDPATGQQKRAIEVQADALTFSPDGKSLAFGGGTQNAVGVLDPASGVVRRMASVHAARVTHLRFSPDGRMLASASRDRRVKLWSAADGKLLRTLGGHTNDIHGLAFTPDGKLLATASWDGTVKLWEVQTGAALATLLLIDEQDWLVITPAGLFDGSPGAWNKILWRLSPQTFDIVPVEIFFNEFFRPGLLSEIAAGSRPRPQRSVQQIDSRQPNLRLSIAEAPDGAVLEKRRIKVRVRVAEALAGARDVRLFRNGALVKAWRGDVLNDKPQAALEAEVPLVSGDNMLSAYAFNKENVKSGDAQFNIGDLGLPARAATTYILAIGVDHYANSQFDLRYAVADAESFAAEFQRQQKRLDPAARVEIIPLHDQNARKAQLLGALSDLARRVKPEDTVAVFFAGHGLANGQRFYLVPHDLGFPGERSQLSASDLKAVYAHSVSDRDLERAFEGIDAARLMLIIDACHSGQALDAAERRRGPMNSAGLAQLAYEKGMYVLTAAQSYQAAQELSELQHGLLTYSLVEEGMKKGLADAAPRDGTILLREWLDFATDRVPALQIERMRKAAARGIKLAYVAGEESLPRSEDRNVQRPRVFYRREAESEPFAVARGR